MAKSASWSRCLGLLIGLWVLLHGSEAQQPGSTLTSQWCHDDVCYHLYQFNETSGGTWGSANDQCQVHGLHLTAIPNQEIQNALDAAPPLERNGVGSAWLAGRRSDDNRAVWLNNKVNDEVAQPSTGYTCGVLSNLKISFMSCLTPYMCLCEQNNESDCPFDTVAYRDKCVWIISDTMSWYNCRMKCNEAGGDLAALLGGIPEVASALTSTTGISLFNRRYRRINIWIGLQIRPWNWISGTGQASSTREPMVYYNFGSGINFFDCLYIDMATSRQWHAQVCYAKTPFFVCDDDSLSGRQAKTSDTPGVTPATPRSAGGPLVSESDSTNANGESPAGGASGLTTGALAGILVVVFGLVVAITVLSIILWRRHRRVTSSPETNSPTGLAVVGTPTASLGATGRAEKEENYYCEPTDFEKPSVNPVDTYPQKEV